MRALWRVASAPSSGRAAWPTSSGSTSHSTRPSTTEPNGSACPEVPSTTLSQSGVSTTPSKLDKVALKTAAATLPRAAAVSATDEDTVDGSAHRKNKPVRSAVPRCEPASPSSSSPSSGNSKKVDPCTSKCRRHFRVPAASASNDSVSPCKKKISATPSLFVSSGCKLPPLAPASGNNQASAT